MGLVWLLLLLFPVISLAAQPPGTVAGAAVLLTVLLLAYVRTVLLISRTGAPRLYPVQLAIVTLAAVVLPLACGGQWAVARCDGVPVRAVRAELGFALFTAAFILLLASALRPAAERGTPSGE